jgi:predicted choloylglycine hydrolase
MNRLMKGLKVLGMVGLLILTWAVGIVHIGVMLPPQSVYAMEGKPVEPGLWIDKSTFGMHQLVLSGSPYTRGLESGRLTKHLLDREEEELTHKLREFLPNPIMVAVLEIAAIRWFWGIDAYFEPWMTEEMYGVSKSSSHEYDNYADPYTRQIAYHGVHEVGQMTVDQGVVNMGCTVAALPFHGSWIIGRNFDFEASRIFDDEKILKWVFPDNGFAFVSVIWAGMVGAVTGVNENGVYISINAAGTTDFSRYGMPSTLVIVKALQNAKTVDDAVRIIRDEPMFITDIFVTADHKTGKAYRIEKSPKRTEVIPIVGPSIITNHLISNAWKDDSFNLIRRDELTSTLRSSRGEEILKSTPNLSSLDASALENFVLNVLRDKGEAFGKPLTLGNRRAIDALIAAHSVIYNAPDGIFYVSQGPGVSGAFTGFDLRASFAARMPVAVKTLPRDPLVSDVQFVQVRKSEVELASAHELLDHKDCDGALLHINIAGQNFSQSSGYYSTLGDYWLCKGDGAKAHEAWKVALAMSPAYPKQTRILEGKLNP